jgi:hypothetical protein
MKSWLIRRGSDFGVLGGALLLACVALAMLLALQLSGQPSSAVAADAAPAPDPARADGAASGTATPATPALIPLEKFQEIVDRPVFHASRKPVPQETDEAPGAVAVELRNLTLIGVLISPETKLAIFSDKGAQSLRVEAGANVGKWSLAEVRGDGVTLRRGGETHEIPLYRVDSPHWSMVDGTNQVVSTPVRGADAKRIQTQKAPTREDRFRRKQSRSS